jgi:hypothetical protein
LARGTRVLGWWFYRRSKMAQPNDVPHGHMYGKTFRLKIDRKGGKYLGTWSNEGPDMEERLYKKGDIVKVVMVSRFGDCGITHNLDAVNGYETRVAPEDLEEVT